LRDWNCDPICLQETKLQDVELSDIWSIWGNQPVGFSVLKATASDVLVLWNTNSSQLVSSSCGDFPITCFLQMGDGSFFWAFTGIYEPHDRVDKLRMLDELGHVRDGGNGPRCMGGISMKSCILIDRARVFALPMPWLSFGILSINRPQWIFL